MLVAVLLFTRSVSTEDRAEIFVLRVVAWLVYKYRVQLEELIVILVTSLVYHFFINLLKP